MRIRPCGEQALLIEVEDFDAVIGLHSALADPLPTGVLELVPAARTLLVHFDPAVVDAATLARELADTTPARPTPRHGELLTVPVVYDGADLHRVGELTGLGVAGVIAAHTGHDHTATFTGFTPGFTYLTGLDPRLRLPRRDTVRPAVPAGTVGVADDFTGVYPTTCPGAWHLLGRTNVPMWDGTRARPRITPGTRVRFEAVTELPAPPEPVRSTEQARPTTHPTTPDPAPGPDPAGAIEVLGTGPLTTVQDLGRPGMAELGIGRSGAADRRSAALANRLVGNPDDTACFEVTLGGLAVRFHRRARVALTGATVPIRRAGHGEPMNTAFTVDRGEELVLGTPSAGLRTYVAVRGGVEVPSMLDSRATDLLSGLGPPTLAAGDLLPIGSAPARSAPRTHAARIPAPATVDLLVRVVLGPRDDWFTPEALRTLTTARYRVTERSDRIGLWLDGPPLARAHDRELASEGTVTGAIQVPASGQPVLLLADHPVTDGHPVIAVVVDDDLPVVAQARPGQRLSFTTMGTHGTHPLP